jgi:hypothetical protein
LEDKGLVFRVLSIADGFYQGPLGVGREVGLVKGPFLVFGNIGHDAAHRGAAREDAARGVGNRQNTRAFGVDVTHIIYNTPSSHNTE